VIYDYIFSLESATHVSLHVPYIVVLDTDWPAGHGSYVYAYINQ
jgi:hypothetical protein